MLLTNLDIKNPRVVSFGLIFAAIIFSVSYRLFYLNNFKILITFIGIVFLFLLFDVFFNFIGNKKLNDQPNDSSSLALFKILLLSFLPLLACLPGLIFFENFIPLFVLQETISMVLPILWMGYLLRELYSLDLWEKFLFWTLLVTLFTCCWGILEFWGVRLDDLKTPYENVNRITSVFGNVNYFAGYLIVVLPFLTHMSIAQWLLLKNKEDRPFPHFLLTVVVVIGGITLHLTKSRTAIMSFYVSMGLCACYWLWIEGYARTIFSKLKKYFILALPLFFLGGFGFLYIFFKVSRLIEGGHNLVSRLISWKTAMDSITQSPFWGYGPGTSYQLYFDFRNPNFRLFTQESAFRHVHFELLEILQEGGFFAFSFYLLFWGVVFFILYSLARGIFRKKSINNLINIQSESETKKMGHFSLALAFSFIAYFIHSCFSIAPRTMTVKIPLYSYLGFAFFLSHYVNFSRFKWLGKIQNHKKRKILFSLPLYQSAVFLLLILFTGWGLYQFIPTQYAHQQLRRSPLDNKSIEPFEKLVNSKSSPYLLGELIDRQIRLRRIAPLARTIKQLDEIFPRWQSQQHVKALFYLETGREEEAIASAINFQENIDKYFEPNIRVLMDNAVRRGDYDFFKKQFFYYLRLKFFQERVYLYNIIFQATQGTALFEEQKGEDKLFFLYSDKILKDFFQSAEGILIKDVESATNNEKRITEYRKKVTETVSRANYFRIELKTNFTDNDPIKIQQLQSDMNQLFQLWHQREFIKSKEAYQQREKRRHQTVYNESSSILPLGMQINLLRRKEENEIVKKAQELHRQFHTLAHNSAISNPVLHIKKNNLKKIILDILYRLPLLRQ